MQVCLALLCECSENWEFKRMLSELLEIREILFYSFIIHGYWKRKPLMINFGSRNWSECGQTCPVLLRWSWEKCSLHIVSHIWKGIHITVLREVCTSLNKIFPPSGDCSQTSLLPSNSLHSPWLPFSMTVPSTSSDKWRTPGSFLGLLPLIQHGPFHSCGRKEPHSHFSCI